MLKLGIKVTLLGSLVVFIYVTSPIRTLRNVSFYLKWGREASQSLHLQAMIALKQSNLNTFFVLLSSREESISFAASRPPEVSLFILSPQLFVVYIYSVRLSINFTN